MPERTRSRARSPELVVAAVYRRDIEASIERVWENVRDWEHLPWLHSDAFASIELKEGGDWGWHAQIGFHGGGEAELELVIDAAEQRYVSRTLSGSGAPGEIWTQLESIGPDRTAIQVEFCLKAPPEKLAALGESYEALYTQLWDEDEEMMQRRAAALRARGQTRKQPGQPAGSPPDAQPTGAAERIDEPAPLRLGPLSALRERMPLTIDWSGQRFRIVETDGRLIAHSVVCPHWLGPLDECAIVEGTVVCPWHGYAFDAETGESADGRRFRLATAPRVRVEATDGGPEEVIVSAG